MKRKIAIYKLFCTKQKICIYKMFKTEVLFVISNYYFF